MQWMGVIVGLLMALVLNDVWYAPRFSCVPIFKLLSASIETCTDLSYPVIATQLPY
jgi:hypothetical protein